MCIEFGPVLPVQRIAPKGGIICYKVMYRLAYSNYWISASQYFQYFDGKRNPSTKIRIRNCEWGWVGHNGYHSFATKAGAETYTYSLQLLNAHIVQCLIPAGAKYYVGNFCGQANYISSRIVITGNLKTGNLKTGKCI